jgi:hypothetical protein
MFNPIPWHEAKMGNYILTPEGEVYVIDCDDSLNNMPQVAFWYQSQGLEILLFEEFWQANFWNHRN